MGLIYMIPFPYRMTKEGFSTTNDISLINSLSDTIKTNDQTLYCATTPCEAAVDSSTPAVSTPSLDNSLDNDCANTPAPTTGTAEVGNPCISSPTGCTASDQICASDLICGSNSGECEAAVDESIPADSSLVSDGQSCAGPEGPDTSCDSGYCAERTVSSPHFSFTMHVCGPSPNR